MTSIAISSEEQYRLLSMLFTVSTALQVCFAGYFSTLGNGFSAIGDGHVFRCRELLSSGSDDEVTLMVFVLMLFPAGLRLFRIDLVVSTGEVVLYYFLLAIGLVVVFFGLECGHYWVTVFSNFPNSLSGFTFFGGISFLSFALLLRCRSV